MKKITDFIHKTFDYFKNHSDQIGYVLLALLYVFIHIEIWNNLEASIQSDMSSELVLAKILAQQKRIITTDWYYSTELKVLHNTLIFAPLFYLTDNWHIIRMVSIAVLNLIMFGGYYYLAKKLEIKHIPWIGMMIVGATSRGYYKDVTLGSHYIPDLVISFITIGLIIDIFKTSSKTKKIVDIAIFLALSFVSSLSGMRFVAVLHLPLLATAALYYLLKQFKNLKKGKVVLKDETVYLIGLCFAGFVVSYAGAYVNSHILPQLGYSYKLDGGEINYIGFSFDSVGMVINGWLNMFGYQSDNLYVFSIHQLILKPLFAVYFVVICWSVIDILRNHKKYNKYEVFIALFFLVGALIMTALYTLTNTWFRDRYLMPVSIFTVFTIGIFFTHYKFDWQKWIFVLFITMFVLANTVFQIQFHLKYDSYRQLADVRDALLENECYAGYAMDHWEGGHNLLTELSDGKIETWRFYDGDLNKIVSYLQAKDHHIRKPEGKVYLIVTREELNNNEIVLKDGIDNYKCYEDDVRILYIFDNYSKLESFVG